MKLTTRFADLTARDVLVVTCPACHRTANVAPHMLVSLIETYKLNKIEPHSYLTGVLTAIANGHKQKHIHQLLPSNFKG